MPAIQAAVSWFTVTAVPIIQQFAQQAAMWIQQFAAQAQPIIQNFAQQWQGTVGPAEKSLALLILILLQQTTRMSKV